MINHSFKYSIPIFLLTFFSITSTACCKRKETPNPTLNTATKQVNSTLSDIPSISLLTFKNDLFEIQYPKTWEYKENALQKGKWSITKHQFIMPPEAVLQSRPFILISGTNEEKERSLDYSYRNWIAGMKDSAKDITILSESKSVYSGAQGYRAVISLNNQGICILVYILKTTDFLYHITCMSSLKVFNNVLNDFENVIDTFRPLQ